MNIQFYDKEVECFIRSLQKPTIAKALRMLDLLERFGYKLGMPHSKQITAGLFELRVRGMQEVRRGMELGGWGRIVRLSRKKAAGGSRATQFLMGRQQPAEFFFIDGRAVVLREFPYQFDWKAVRRV